jgi:hypothetical protein
MGQAFGRLILVPQRYQQASRALFDRPAKLVMWQRLGQY